MMALLHSELIKGKHSYTRKLLVIFTLGVSVLALFLNGLSNNAIFSIYNWWYMMFLPAVVILISSNAITIDKKMNFANLSLLPVSKSKSWLAKTASVICYLFISNLIIFVLSTIAAQLIGFPTSILNGLIVTFVLTITFAWQIPLSMFLVTRFNTSVTFLFLIVFNVVCSSQTISGGNLWWIPFSIPARVMAPLLKMNPNGIPLDATSPLNNYNVVIPGLLITVGLFALLSFLSSQWFEQKEIG